MVSESNIELHTAGTPNGHKVNILLEELGLNYTVHAIDISKNVQKEDWFLKINPNGRIPAIVDKTSGKEKRIFEGGAILLYLTERYDKENKVSFTYDTDEYWEVVEWITWMQSGIGPMQGQANHFFRYAPTRIDYGINRYQTETKRLYDVLNSRLRAQKAAGQGLWLVGGKYSIADLASFSWVNWAEWAGIPLEPFPEVREWLGVIAAREASVKGCNVPEKFAMKEAMKTKEGEEEYTKYHSSWVMKGQEKDQETHK